MNDDSGLKARRVKFQPYFFKGHCQSRRGRHTPASHGEINESHDVVEHLY